MSYTKKTWASGETVTSSALNNMEEGIDNAANPFIVTLTPTSQDFSGTMDKTVAEINTAYEAGKRIVFRFLLSLTEYIDVDVTAVYTDGSTYPSFNAFSVNTDLNIILLVMTGATNNGTQNTYSTAIYPLTPMT